MISTGAGCKYIFHPRAFHFLQSKIIFFISLQPKEKQISTGQILFLIFPFLQSKIIFFQLFYSKERISIAGANISQNLLMMSVTN